MRIRCVSPARGGSRGVPRKNLRVVGGRPPLIVSSVERALSARPAMDVVVSTDDEEIAAVARTAGALVPFLRPVGLARDTTPTEPVVRDAIAAARAADAAPDAAMLQATSPLRLAGPLSRSSTLSDTGSAPSRHRSAVTPRSSRLPRWCRTEVAEVHGAVAGRS